MELENSTSEKMELGFQRNRADAVMQRLKKARSKRNHHRKEERGTKKDEGKMTRGTPDS